MVTVRRRSRLAVGVQHALLVQFVTGTPARTAAELVGVNHCECFADGKRHINGIENFWNQAKRHLRHYNGIPRQHFHLYPMECEWRFNYRPASRLLATLENWAEI
jgi:transposase-like protein